MKRILTILFVLVNSVIYSQATLTDLNLVFDISESNSYSSPFVVKGTVLHSTSEYNGNDINVGDLVYFQDGTTTYSLPIITIDSQSYSYVELQLIDISSTVSYVPTGRAALIRTSNPDLLPVPPDGIPSDLEAGILNDLRLKIQNGVTAAEEITDYAGGVIASPMVAPAVSPSSYTGKTWRNSMGVLYRSDGIAWTPIGGAAFDTLYTDATNQLLVLQGPNDSLSTSIIDIAPVQSITAGTGISVVPYPGGIYNINSTGDLSNTNELQTLSSGTNTVTLSNSGGTVTVDTDPTNDITSLSGGTGISVSGSGNSRTVTNTGDLSNTNELQTLSISNDTLSISDGNSVVLPGGGVTWPLLAPNGLSEAPSYSFNDNQQNGIFQTNKNIVLQSADKNILLTTLNVAEDNSAKGISGQSGSAENGDGGPFQLFAGNSISAGGGAFDLKAGSSESSQGGAFTMAAGNGATGGAFTMSSGSGGIGGVFAMYGGSGIDAGGGLGMYGGSSTDGDGGYALISGGSSDNSNGGVVIIYGGNSPSSQGGAVLISGGEGSGGNRAHIEINNILRITPITVSVRDAIIGKQIGYTVYCSNCTATDGSTGVLQTYNGSTWKNHWGGASSIYTASDTMISGLHANSIGNWTFGADSDPNNSYSSTQIGITNMFNEDLMQVSNNKNSKEVTIDMYNTPTFTGLTSFISGTGGGGGASVDISSSANEGKAALTSGGGYIKSSTLPIKGKKGIKIVSNLGNNAEGGFYVGDPQYIQDYLGTTVLRGERKTGIFWQGTESSVTSNNVYKIFEADYTTALVKADSNNISVKFYNGAYRLPNAKPSITNTTKQSIVWTGNGTVATPAFETIVTPAQVTQQIADSTLNFTDSPTIDFTQSATVTGIVKTQSIDSTHIKVGGIELEGLSRDGATSGQVVAWNGTTWVPTTITSGSTYTAGAGISIVSNVITNTGDTNAADDLTTSTSFSGDVTGLYNNLQIAANAVGTTEIADNSVSANKIGAAQVTMSKINQSSATTGQIISWDGTTWTPSNIGYSGIGDVIGTASSLTVTKIQNRGVATTAPTTGQVLAWSGSLWAPTTISSGGITSLNGQTGTTQTFFASSTGTDFAISSSGNVHTFVLPTANSTQTGKLTSSDWTTFSNKIGGSGANNQLAVFNGTGTVTSSTGATYNGTVFSISGEVVSTGVMKPGTLGTSSTVIVGRNASNQLSTVGIGAGLDFTGGTLSASNFYTADGTLIGSRTVTMGNLNIAFDASTSGTNNANPIRVKGIATGGNTYYPLIFQNESNADKLSFKVGASEVSMLTTTENLKLGTGSQQWILNNVGSITMPALASNPTTANSSMWINSTTNRLMVKTPDGNFKSIATLQDDLSGGNLQFSTSQSIGNTNFGNEITNTLTADITITLDGTLTEGREYKLFNSNNGATWDTFWTVASGYTVKLKDVGNVTSADGLLTMSPYRLFIITRYGNTIYVSY